MAHADFCGAEATVHLCNGHFVVTSGNINVPVANYASVRKVMYVINPENQEPWNTGQRPQLERFSSCHSVTITIHLEGHFLQHSSITTGAIALKPFDGESTAAREQVTGLEVCFQAPQELLEAVIWNLAGLALRLPGYLPRLTSLDLSSLPRLNRDRHQRDHFGKALAQLPSLKELVVPCCDDLEGLEYLRLSPLSVLRVYNSAQAISMMGSEALASVERIQFLKEFSLENGAVLLQPSYVSRMADGLKVQDLLRGEFPRSLHVQVNVCSGFAAAVCDLTLCLKLTDGALESVAVTSTTETHSNPLLMLSRLAQQIRATRKLSPRFELDLRTFVGFAPSTLTEAHDSSLKPLRKLLERCRRVHLPQNVYWKGPGGRGKKGTRGEVERVLALMGKPCGLWLRTELAVRKAARRAHDGLLRRLS